ncbi:hypothetical protein EYF80_039197 [Liparis tanakae]|uniref:Uncharacterized protein n=1 Tax=Liparis tanakae TaxID=230148 RepID=A0A4Z2GCG8_9TELE|nr:hypothetical protein EYF80_039197 [Liparis tanakae]
MFLRSLREPDKDLRSAGRRSAVTPETGGERESSSLCRLKYAAGRRSKPLVYRKAVQLHSLANSPPDQRSHQEVP